MNNKQKNLIVDASVILVILGLIILGTFKDLAISEKIYIGNEWINFFVAIIAKIPAYAFGFYACVCLFALAKDKEDKAMRIFLMCLYAGGAAICGMLGLEDLVESFISNFVEKTILYYAVAFVISAAVFYPVYLYISKKGSLILSANKKAYLSVILALGIIVVLSFVLKEFIERTRYEDVLFRLGRYTKWYEKGYGGDSFPSGHTASAMAIIACYPLLKNIKILSDKKWIFDISIFVYVICVALSRIAFGMHYLTDVAFAALIAYVVSKAVYYVMFGFNDNYEIKQGSLLEKF